MLVSFDAYRSDVHSDQCAMHTRRKFWHKILIVMLQIFDNLFHYKNILTVQWIKRLKLCMVTMVTLPPAKGLKYR